MATTIIRYANTCKFEIREGKIDFNDDTIDIVDYAIGTVSPDRLYYLLPTGSSESFVSKLLNVDTDPFRVIMGHRDIYAMSNRQKEDLLKTGISSAYRDDYCYKDNPAYNAEVYVGLKVKQRLEELAQTSLLSCMERIKKAREKREGKEVVIAKLLALGAEEQKTKTDIVTATMKFIKSYTA